MIDLHAHRRLLSDHGVETRVEGVHLLCDQGGEDGGELPRVRGQPLERLSVSLTRRRLSRKTLVRRCAAEGCVNPEHWSTRGTPRRRDGQADPKPSKARGASRRQRAVERGVVALEGATGITEIPVELEAGWRRLAASPSSEAVKAAVARVFFGGERIETVLTTGISRRHVWDCARRCGLIGRVAREREDAFARIVAIGADEIETRLVDKPEDLSTQEVTQATRMAAELLRASGGGGAGDSYLSSLDRLAERLLEKGGGSLEIRVSKSVPDAVEEAIDVTP